MKKGAIILCGGKSSRMGRDKATLPFGPELMLQRVIRILGQVVEAKAIVAVAASEQVLPALPFEIVIARDQYPERGPLEGLRAGLRSLPHEVDAVYATSCDVPLLVPACVTYLFDRLGDYDIAVPFDGQFYHPLAAIYRPRVLEAVESMLAADQRRLRFLFDRVRTLEVPVDELRSFDPTLATFVNLNEPADYQNALARAGLSASE